MEVSHSMHPIRMSAGAEERPRLDRAHGIESAPGWATLVSGIREGNPEAPVAFKELYRRGIRLFFRRQLGSVALPQLVEEALDGAVRDIRSGRIAHAADLVNFLRNVLEREQLVRELSPNPSLAALATATDHGRLRREASFIEQALGDFTEAEQQALRAYYSGDITASEAASRAGLPAAGFAQLRERLYQSVRAAGLRKMPGRSTTPIGAERALAASSGA